MSISSSWSPSLLPLIHNTNEDDSSRHNSPFQNLKPSILLIFLTLSITFLLSLSLCLLLRQLNRRCLLHLSPSSASPPTSITVSSNRVSPHTHTDLAAFSVVDSLPLFTYSSIKRPSSASTADCAVCLSKFEPQDQLRLLPLCCHAFHAHCIDTWLLYNHTCPLCRSTIHASDSDLFNAASSDSFRLEIGSISRRQAPPDPVFEPRTSYSLGSFDYIVDDESEVTMTRTHSRRSVSDKDIGAPVSEELNVSVGGGGRGWLKDYVDRLSNSLSSRTLSFRSSGRFFTGSSRRSEIASIGDYDMEANRVGEEISEMFRWFSGV